MRMLSLVTREIPPGIVYNQMVISINNNMINLRTDVLLLPRVMVLDTMLVEMVMELHL
jgi:hypothetical protein